MLAWTTGSTDWGAFLGQGVIWIALGLLFRSFSRPDGRDDRN